MNFLLGGCATALLMFAFAVPAAFAQKIFAPQAELNTNAQTDSGDDIFVQMATDFEGTWIAIWNSTDPLDGTLESEDNVLFARSVDNGDTWSPPAALSDNTEVDAQSQLNSPHIATDGRGAWIVVWSARGRFGTDLDILAAQSTDNGETWTEPVFVNSNARIDFDTDSNPRIATDRLGRWMTVWSGQNDDNDDVTYYARSKDNGAHWTKRRSPGSGGGDELGIFADVAVDERKNWIVVWSEEFANESQFGGDFEIVAARTSNFGTTWSGPQVLNSDATTDVSTDHDFTVRIASAGKAKFVAVWMRRIVGIGIEGGEVILACGSTDAGASWSSPVKLDIADINVQNLVGFPQVASDGRKTFSVVWHHHRRLPSPTPDRFDVFISTSSDTGLTWTSPLQVNRDADRESGANGLPDITTDRGNRSIVTWSSNVVLRSRDAVSDLDIHYAPDF